MILFGIDIKNVLFRALLPLYQKVYLPFRVFHIRRKRVIKVAFVISDLGKWKTETLFLKMKAHCKFAPSLLVLPYEKYDNSGLTVLRKYLDSRGYPYCFLNKEQKITDMIKPDIIFYQEPYSRIIHKNKRYKYNLSSLFCYVNYAFHTIDENWSINQTLLNFCWQIYYENYLAKQNASTIMTNKGKNCIVTGLPFSDLFLQPMSYYSNPWRKQEKLKKRIIWAPHHSIQNDEWISYSTFFDYYDYMIYLALKYKDYIQMAFKPHPLLLTKLYLAWGKKKTDDYYAQWANGENTQLVLGDYVPLFIFSDALVHDCSSFTVEYHYTQKPVLYLIKDEHHADGLNEFGKMAFDLHYKGRCVEDIEAFINDVIKGKDIKKETREEFYNNYLLPPNGNSASENIINAILDN